MINTAYLIQISLISLVFVVFYQLALKQHTFFKQNRFYLLFSFLFALAIPFFRLPQINIESVASLSYTLNEVVINGSEKSQALISQHQIFTTIYIGVFSILALRIVMGLWKIYRIKRNAELHIHNGVNLYLCEEKINPFSIYKGIFVHKELKNNDEAFQRVFKHELAHIQQKHSFDLIISEVLCAIFWINPFFWWLKKELKSTHEYLADEKVLEQDFDLAEYFMLIFNNVVGENVGLANNFNQSLNIKRMKMMKKKRSSRFLKRLNDFAIPSLFVLVGLVAVQCKNSNIIESKAATVEKTEDKAFTVVEKMPEFPGGNEALIKYLRANVKYPDEAKEKGVQGRVYVEFVVNKEGKITKVSSLRINSKIADSELDSEKRDEMKKCLRLLSDEAKRVILAMPDWTPGEQKGKKVNVSYRLPINFALR